MSSTEQETDIVVALRRAAQHLYDQRSLRDLGTILGQLVEAAVQTVPGAAGGGISRTEGGAVRSNHATDPVISSLDQRQSMLHEGPCVTAADDPPDDGVILADDLAGADAQRWPAFAPYAVEAGYRSMLSNHLAARRGGVHSALNLYAHAPHAFDAHGRQIAALFALQASALIYGADEAANLGRALDSRDVIGRAKGILMERFTVGDTEAFQMLVASSQDTNIKLVDVATWLTSEAEQRRAAAAPDRRTRPS